MGVGGGSGGAEAPPGAYVTQVNFAWGCISATEKSLVASATLVGAATELAKQLTRIR